MSDLPDWSTLTGEQKDDIIRPLWQGGKTAGEIMFYFIGASRNAVIGRVTRGKMGARVQRSNSGTAPKAPAPAKPKPAPKPRPAPIRLPMASPDALPEPVPGSFNPLIDDRPPLDGVPPISILELPRREGGRCRFPVIGGYCGYATETTYCEPHTALATHFVRKSLNGSLARKR